MLGVNEENMEENEPFQEPQEADVPNLQNGPVPELPSKSENLILP